MPLIDLATRQQRQCSPAPESKSIIALRAGLAAVYFLLAACASGPQPSPAPVAQVIEMPVLTPVAEPLPPQTPPAEALVGEAPLPVPPPTLVRRDARRLLNRLLPAGIADRDGWSRDILTAFAALQLEPDTNALCAAIATIEQESSWQADPVVPGLNRMVWKEIEKRAGAWHVPMFLVEAALMKPSPGGRSYKQRIDGLRTEKQMNTLFEDLSAEAGSISPGMRMENPIRTGGPMQVSISFADAHIRAWPHYPYALQGSVRREVFSRRGGVYFGIANLLHYPVSYTQMRFRFADYNAGRYSSRNAAFQSALARLSSRRIDLDGDLLRYEKGRPAARESASQKAALDIAGQLQMTREAIKNDLAREKTAAFENTRLWKRVFSLADARAQRALPRQLMPQIRLSSPKISRRLTTEWFAGRVDARYRKCQARDPEPASSSDRAQAAVTAPAAD